MYTTKAGDRRTGRNIITENESPKKESKKRYGKLRKNHWLLDRERDLDLERDFDLDRERSLDGLLKLRKRDAK